MHQFRLEPFYVYAPHCDTNAGIYCIKLKIAESLFCSFFFFNLLNSWYLYAIYKVQIFILKALKDNGS